MGSERDDDLARTATAAASASGPLEQLGATLGRYRLERELGAGGMGVVHAAFDPDLERRIALKVLRVSAPSIEAKDRLMREARAMARLSHPNVVTVHEVGTAHGRDFVAMELIHGETLADWVRATSRPTAALIDAFVAAGRGLAAAHAAGIVHRDFKPHNVLRSRDGRIVVTDFGLARDAEGAAPTGLETTLPIHASSTASTTPSALSGLTMTGALLGTPAYMAPEQWSRGAVTPATDQFAYCVALWEALTGERPYRGPSLDDLRDQVARGPAALDASRIPRRLRPILRRGLDPVPGQRWPSMDALLAQLVRAERRPGIALAIIAATVAAAAVLYVALHDRTPVLACDAPTRDVATVWSPVIASALRAQHPAHAGVLDAAFSDWQAARRQACEAPLHVKQAQLLCLDGVLARFEALREGFAGAPDDASETIQGQLIDPQICRKPTAAEVPRLTLAPSLDVVAGYLLYARADRAPVPGDDSAARDAAALLARRDLEPCARVIATLALRFASKDMPRVRRAIIDASSMVDQCGDERLRADLLIEAVPYLWEFPMVGPKGEGALRQAQAAAVRVMQPDLAAALAGPRMALAQQSQHWDEAFRLADAAIAGYGARGLQRRQLHAVKNLNDVRLTRVLPEDLAAVVASVAQWRPIAAATQRAALISDLDVQVAKARFWLGDVSDQHADLLRVWRAQPHDDVPGPSRVIAGEVVDARGQPVAGATVSAGSILAGDSIAAAVPLIYDFDRTLAIVTTDAAGRFTIPQGAMAGAVIAQLGALRSPPSAIADHVRLVLQPTRAVRGTIDLRGLPRTHADVAIEPASDPTGRYHLVTPVLPDGTFALTGVPVTALRIGLTVAGSDGMGGRSAFQRLPPGRAAITDVALAVPSSSRTIDIIVRSAIATPLDGAQVIIFDGTQHIANVGEVIRLQADGMQTGFARPVVGENAPPRTLDKLQPGDLVAHIQHAHAGPLTACAISFNGDLFDPAALKRMQAHISELTIRCEHLGPDADLVVILAPPQQRFD